MIFNLSNLDINRAQQSDVGRLALLLLELDKIHNESAPERFPLHSLETRKEDLKKILDCGYIFYAQNGSEVVAFASLLNKENALVLEHLFVKPEYRLQSIATTLIKNIFEEFSDREIFTTAYAFNSQAIKFYSNFFELSSLVFKKNQKMGSLK